jgi:hypothetical protein
MFGAKACWQALMEPRSRSVKNAAGAVYNAAQGYHEKETEAERAAVMAMEHRRREAEEALRAEVGEEAWKVTSALRMVCRADVRKAAGDGLEAQVRWTAAELARDPSTWSVWFGEQVSLVRKQAAKIATFLSATSRLAPPPPTPRPVKIDLTREQLAAARDLYGPDRIERAFEVLRARPHAGGVAKSWFARAVPLTPDELDRQIANFARWNNVGATAECVQAAG